MNNTGFYSYMKEVVDVVDVTAAPSGLAGAPEICFILDGGIPYYQVNYNGQTLVEKSQLGIQISSGGQTYNLTEELSVVSVEKNSGDTTWQPAVGETAEIRDYYNEAAVTLKHSSGMQLAVQLRVYDTGVALRYVLPGIPDNQVSYTILSEDTYFKFPAGTYTAYGCTDSIESNAQEIENGNFSASVSYLRPMTLLYSSGTAMTICEANLDNFAVMAMCSTGQDTLKSMYSYKGVDENNTVVIEKNHPGVSPWRTFVLAENENGLQENSSIVLNLNESADEDTYRFSEWAEPGSCLRVYRSKPGKLNSDLSQEGILKSIDLAAADGIPYISLDTGWYGPERDPRTDPRLDPSVMSDDNLLKQFVTGPGCFQTSNKPFEVFGSLENLFEDNLTHSFKFIYTDVNIPEICEYGKKRGVGLVLYVNNRHLRKAGASGYTVDDLFTLFEEWGVSGVKPGFIDCNTQARELAVQEVIEAAAKHRLVMTIHDEWVPTGIERTFPNLLTAEGIRGDEGLNKSDIGKGDLTALFARTVQGPVDHTYKLPGKGTMAYQLASPLMFRTGLNFLYWFTSPDAIPEHAEGKLDFWKELPATWDESVYLEGKIKQYATYARRNGEKWWLGSLTDYARSLTVKLDFMDIGKKYVANIFADLNGNIENKQYIVESTTTLKSDLPRYGGYAVKFTSATQDEIDTLPWYD